ncbi:hypothetical protein [Ruegeria meonggei]|uniref:Uncharacterized protein n=1 Tax=Ruegeria meonggei TaxID=1446476 RepID=A0A1X6Z405_9RHOB|nr:hypothetical protein [Ruegeria meonggei]SLN38005.1 hypothetical protein RUM8411_01667 [Ruegeria meonggei]
MTHSTLTPVLFEDGIWMGHIQTETEPAVQVHYRDQILKDFTVSAADNGWDLHVEIPISALSDGVHCFVILDASTAEKLGDFTIIAGSPASEDLRAQIELLRAELDMLKRAFRRMQHPDG